MKLYKTKKGILLARENEFYRLHQPWDELINRSNLHHYLQSLLEAADILTATEADALLNSELSAPIGTQELGPPE